MLSIGSKLRLLRDRITISKITTIYFIFSVAHCFIQVILQVQAFSINKQAATFLFSIIEQGNATEPNSFVVLGQDSLRQCDHVPTTFSTSTCNVLWNGTVLYDNYDATEKSSLSSSSSSSGVVQPSTVTIATTVSLQSSSAVTESQSADKDSSTLSTASPATNRASSATTATATATKNDDDVIFQATSTLTDTATATTITTVKIETGDDDNDGKKGLQKRYNYETGTIAAVEVNGTVEVTVNGLGYNGEELVLDPKCLSVLNYPVEVLDNTKREDITFIAFQLWKLGMSVVAILNESIPHIIASLLTHMLATAWAGFQIFHTAQFRASFTTLATKGACAPQNLLPNYWQERRDAELPILISNMAALFISAILTWRLVKLFGWQTFKRVGASVTINRVYKIVLLLSIVIQLALFFVVATIGLWIDQLFNGQIAHLAKEALVYKVVFIIVLLLMVPWLTAGWFAVRRELKLPMFFFLALSFGYMAGTGAMFSSATFRWTFIQWRFFALITTSGVVLMLVAFVIGLICRVNFGKGLLRYLSAQEPIPDKTIPDPFTSSPTDDEEKFEFPSQAGSIPTFSVAFGSGQEVPLPSQMFPNSAHTDRELKKSVDSSVYVPTGLKRAPSSGSLGPERDGHLGLTRHDTRGSERSVGSSVSSSESAIGRNNSQSSQSSSIHSKRWVIE